MELDPPIVFRNYKQLAPKVLNRILCLSWLNLSVANCL